MQRSTWLPAQAAPAPQLQFPSVHASERTGSQAPEVPHRQNPEVHRSVLTGSQGAELPQRHSPAALHRSAVSPSHASAQQVPFRHSSPGRHVLVRPPHTQLPVASQRSASAPQLVAQQVPSMQRRLPVHAAPVPQRHTPPVQLSARRSSQGAALPQVQAPVVLLQRSASCPSQLAEQQSPFQHTRPSAHAPELPQRQVDEKIPSEQLSDRSSHALSQQ